MVVDKGELAVDFSNLYPTDTYKGNDNEGVKYSIYRTEDKQDIIAASYSKIVKTESPRYVPYTFDLGYNRSIISSDEDLVIFDEGYLRLLVAALGQEQGSAIYDQVIAGTIVDGTLGNTDSGNSFVIMKKNEVVTIRVTCSEKKPEEAVETSENEENQEENQTEATATEMEATSSVITSGQGQKKEETEAVETEEQAQEETENSEQATE